MIHRLSFIAFVCGEQPTRSRSEEELVGYLGQQQLQKQANERRYLGLHARRHR